MKQVGNSLNARMGVGFLAEESLKRESERLLDDPYASEMIDNDSLSFIRLVKKMIPEMELMFILRTRYIDDLIKEGVKAGAEQVIFWGSKYETRPLRLDILKGGIRIFEVDHPQDSIWKRERVKRIMNSLPEAVAYVPFDFPQDDLRASLKGAGYRESAESLFILEGISFSMKPDEVDWLLRLLPELSGPGSFIVFTYVHVSLVTGIDYFMEAKLHFQGSKAVPEPMSFGLDPQEIVSYLELRGYDEVNNRSTSEIKKKYIGDDQIMVNEYIVRARIKRKGKDQ